MANEAKRVWFEKCDCGETDGGVHGYFYSEAGQFPIPTFSVEAGEAVMQSYPGSLSDEEKAEIRSQFLAAGLPEKATEADWAVAEAAVESRRIEALLREAILNTFGLDVAG